jgi:dTDP-glucose 4,6-dehydratase
MLQVGTDEVYGSKLSGQSKESDVLETNSAYSASKGAADLFVRSFVVTHGADVVITRCTNNYGPFQLTEKFIPRSITNLLDGQPIPIYGDGMNIREWLHVSDHCHAIAVAATKGQKGKIYNIGGGVEKSNLEVARLIISRLGLDEDLIEFVPDRPGHDQRYSVDDGEIRSLGYSPMIEFEQGLQNTIDWYQANEQWWRPISKPIGFW